MPSRAWPRRAHALCALLAIGASTAAQADDFIVYSPHINQGQSEIELRGFYTSDGRPAFDGLAASELSFSHAFTGWWKPEIYVAEYAKNPGESEGLKGNEFENTFQFTQPGQYWVDVGFLASLELPITKGEKDRLEFGPLFEKTDGRFDHRLNLIWEKEIGAGASRHYEFRYSYSGTYALSAAFQPGIEFYGRPDDHAYQIGPVVRGEWHVPGTTSNLEYRIGLLQGINDDAPRRTWLAQIEYEFL
ncbi:MAG: hypothetical protein EPN36_16895 [Rhodanobacteraceae bacterium]|nr:MAG: hypothetical protein EPN36_16895 [Rhodanobacteraceae bacterium]